MFKKTNCFQIRPWEPEKKKAYLINKSKMIIFIVFIINQNFSFAEKLQ